MTNFSDMDSDALIEHLDSHVSATPAITSSHSGPKKNLHSVPLSKLPPLTAHIIREINYSKGKVIDFAVADWNRCEIMLRRLIADDPKLPGEITAYKRDVVPSLPDATARTTEHMTRGLLKEARIPVAELPEDLAKYSLNPSTPGSMRSYHQNDKKHLPGGDCVPESLTGKPKLYHTYVEHFKGLQNKQIKKGVKQVHTGYIEYTAGGWRTGSTDGRIVYDYVRDRFFLTPDHYDTWYVVELDV